MLIDNPTGILIIRDELISILRHLDREEKSDARSFFMSGWDGKQPYSFSRIIRGHKYIKAVCISIIGNTQPSRIIQYVRKTNQDGVGGDGLLQRFTLAAWPDVSSEWENIDRPINADMRDQAWAVFTRMTELTESNVLASGAHRGQYDKVPYFRFTDAAREEFVDWQGNLERRVRGDELSSAMEGHLGKYKKLVSALALINHLADSCEGSVGQAALQKAIAFSKYLESHARQIYSAGEINMLQLDAAKGVLEHIRAGDLNDGFTQRTVHRHGWSNLTDNIAVAEMNLLEELDYLVAETKIGPLGGRPKTHYKINPAVFD